MYKRSTTDSYSKCPWCGRQFTINGRMLDYYRAINEGRTPSTCCKHCGNEFYYRNVTAKYARETGIEVTWKKE